MVTEKASELEKLKEKNKIDLLYLSGNGKKKIR